jgi:hypothetical protein
MPVDIMRPDVSAFRSVVRPLVRATWAANTSGLTLARPALAPTPNADGIDVTDPPSGRSGDLPV